MAYFHLSLKSNWYLHFGILLLRVKIVKGFIMDGVICFLQCGSKFIIKEYEHSGRKFPGKAIFCNLFIC